MIMMMNFILRKVGLVEVKLTKKIGGGGQIWAKRAKIGPEITEEILNEKLHFLFSEITSGRI